MRNAVLLCCALVWCSPARSATRRRGARRKAPAYKRLIQDALAGKSTAGQVKGGSFSKDGWTHPGDHSQIVYDIGHFCARGTLEFEAKGFKNSITGGTRDKMYFAGIHEDEKGNKQNEKSYAELRFNGPNQKHAGKIKLDMGHFPVPYDRHEPTTKKMKWDPDKWYRFKMEWKEKQVFVFLDGRRVVRGRCRYPFQVRYVWIGDVNYKPSYTGPKGIVYRNVRIVPGPPVTPVPAKKDEKRKKQPGKQNRRRK